MKMLGLGVPLLLQQVHKLRPGALVGSTAPELVSALTGFPLADLILPPGDHAARLRGEWAPPGVGGDAAHESDAVRFAEIARVAAAGLSTGRVSRSDANLARERVAMLQHLLQLKSVAELKSLCQQATLAAYGNKPDLVGRLIAFLTAADRTDGTLSEFVETKFGPSRNSSATQQPISCFYRDHFGAVDRFNRRYYELGARCRGTTGEYAKIMGLFHVALVNAWVAKHDARHGAGNPRDSSGTASTIATFLTGALEEYFDMEVLH
jgi:hypothetical protein